MFKIDLDNSALSGLFQHGDKGLDDSSHDIHVHVLAGSDEMDGLVTCILDSVMTVNVP